MKQGRPVLGIVHRILAAVLVPTLALMAVTGWILLGEVRDLRASKLSARWGAVGILAGDVVHPAA